MPGSGTQTRWKLLLAVVSLIILTGVVYWPALHGQFIWDDDDHLTQNPAMTAHDGLRQIWSSMSVSRYYPLTLTSFWVQRQLWGLNPLPYHLVSVALHALSAVIIFFLLRGWNVPGAFAAAAIWAVHPVNVESVAWVTELKNTQSGVCFFLALLCYAKFWREGRRAWYLVALLSFAAGLLSKPSTVTLPIVLLFVAWWQRGRLGRSDIFRVLPFFALSAAMSLLTVIEQQRHVDAIGHEWTLALAERLQLAGRNLWFYAGKILWPREVMFVYPRWKLATGSVIGWIPMVGAVLVCGLLWVWRRRDWARAAILGLGCYTALLLPVLGLVDVYYFRFSFVADHFQYLASAALIALVVAALAMRVRLRTTRVAITSGAVVVLGAMSWVYSPAFHDEESLWRDTLSKYPEAFMAQNNLGTILFARGQYEEAALHLREGVRLQPRIWQTQLALANTLVKLGKLDEATACYRMVLEIRPRQSEAHYNLGVVCTALGQGDQAAEQFRQAIALKPDYPDAIRQLAGLLMKRGNYGEAMQTLRRGLHADPKDAGLASELAWLLATCPESTYRNGFEATQIAENINKRFNSQRADPLDTLAAAYAEAGCFDDAINAARKAMELAAAQRNAEFAAQIGSRLATYERREPYHY
jgi:tetratricopeptide (TPR) repeat protein